MPLKKSHLQRKRFSERGRNATTAALVAETLPSFYGSPSLVIGKFDMDEAVPSRSCKWMTSDGDTVEVGDAGKRAKDLWRSQVFRVSPPVFRSSAVGGGAEIQILPSRPSFHVAAAVGQAPPSDNPAAFMSGLAAACVQEGEEQWQAQQPIWQRQAKEGGDVQQDHELHRRKQALHTQQQQTDQRQQEGHGARREPQMDVSHAQVQAGEERKRSISGIGRLQSVTRLSSVRFSST